MEFGGVRAIRLIWFVTVPALSSKVYVPALNRTTAALESTIRVVSATCPLASLAMAIPEAAMTAANRTQRAVILGRALKRCLRLFDRPGDVLHLSLIG